MVYSLDTSENESPPERSVHLSVNFGVATTDYDLPTVGVNAYYLRLDRDGIAAEQVLPVAEGDGAKQGVFSDANISDEMQRRNDLPRLTI